MSSNDMISIYWGKTHYFIAHHDVENPELPFMTYTSKTLFGAIKKARQLQNDYLPEYGISIGKLKEKHA